VIVDRLVRASAKMTSSSPPVAMISEKTCAGLARWWVEMLIALRASMALAVIAPKMQPPAWAGR
jgi:hypothetical protein